MKHRLKAFLLSGLLLAGAPAAANDTMAVLQTGGLLFVRSDVVAMEKEDLYISMDEVRVAYIFRNNADSDVESLVAFPMPDIVGNPYTDVALPDSQSDNPLHFSVEVDGRAIEPTLEQRVFAAEVDVTASLLAARMPLNPFSEHAYAAVEALPKGIRDDWVVRGILFRESWDDGSGMKEHDVPYWTLKSTYWWRMNFPAGRAVDVRHRYQPSVGGIVGVNFFSDGKVQGPGYEEYKVKYCLDDAVVRAVEREARNAPDGWPPFWESWISYVLTTGANWSSVIHDFRLVIDKGSPDNLVSFCGENIRKIGPTTFEIRETDFYPLRDLDILILRRLEPSRDGSVVEPQREPQVKQRTLRRQ